VSRRPAVAALAVGVALVGLVEAARPLTILYTNDLHLRFARLESLGEWIAEERNAANGPVLLVDAGDAWQDFRTPLAAVWGADAMVDWMNEAGYDAMALGNHDLYWGGGRLETLAARSTFPILCANLVPAPERSAPFVASALRTVGGIRVLLVGAVTDEDLPYPDFSWLRYSDPSAALAEAIAGEPEPVDLVVAIGHLSVAEADGIASKVPEIDVFVTGHSHDVTPKPIQTGRTLIVQAGAFAEQLGRLRLEVTDGGTELVANDLLPTEPVPTDENVGRGRARLAAVAAALLATVLLVLL